MLKKVRSTKIIDILRAVSVFDLLVILLIVAVPVVMAGRGGKSDKGGGGKPSKDTTGTSVVKVDSVAPTSGPIGTNVTLAGSGFSDNNAIKVKGKILMEGLSSEDGTTLSFTLPPEIPCKTPLCLRFESGSGQSEW